MDLEKLYHACLIPATSYRDRSTGVRVSVKPKKGETIMFFPIDSPPNPNCTLRKDLGMKNVCDLVVFYAKGNKQIICLVELKGGNVTHAAKQLISVYQRLQPFLKRSLQSSTFCSSKPSIEWRAYICQAQKSSSHSMRRRKARMTLEKSRKFSRCEISRNPDLGQFLRK